MHTYFFSFRMSVKKCVFKDFLKKHSMVTVIYFLNVA
uniref:Uncharacterized protein n=1 Tax=Anguilla anguilla TaxID=7936 RepID=A0A0E9QLX4_ANGAN